MSARSCTPSGKLNWSGSTCAQRSKRSHQRSVPRQLLRQLSGSGVLHACMQCSMPGATHPVRRVDHVSDRSCPRGDECISRLNTSEVVDTSMRTHAVQHASFTPCARMRTCVYASTRVCKLNATKLACEHMYVALTCGHTLVCSAAMLDPIVEDQEFYCHHRESKACH